MSIEVLNEADPEVDEHELLDCARYVLAEMRVHPQADLCLKLVDEPAMEVLHVQWMDLPGPTDVMSFPMDELRPGRDGQEPEEGVLGDIVLCPSVAARQATEAGHATEEELLLLTVHGILHLLGFDHAEPDEQAEMFELQRALLLTFLAGRSRQSDSAGRSRQSDSAGRSRQSNSAGLGTAAGADGGDVGDGDPPD